MRTGAPVRSVALTGVGTGCRNGSGVPRRAAATLRTNSRPFDMELAETARDIRKRVVGNRPLPLYQGYSEGERSELNTTGR